MVGFAGNMCLQYGMVNGPVRFLLPSIVTALLSMNVKPLHHLGTRGKEGRDLGRQGNVEINRGKPTEPHTK